MAAKDKNNTENQDIKVDLKEELTNNDQAIGGMNEPEADEDLAEFASLKAEVDQWKEKYLRLYAEFDNYRKRTIKEKSEIINTAGADVIKDVLPILDDLERAVAVSSQKSESASLIEGMDLIHKKLAHNLKLKGLEVIESKGQTFDADLHEAITTIPAPSKDLKGKIIDETEKGYRLNGHVIRFAKVVVGQ